LILEAEKQNKYSNCRSNHTVMEEWAKKMYRIKKNLDIFIRQIYTKSNWLFVIFIFSIFDSWTERLHITTGRDTKERRRRKTNIFISIFSIDFSAKVFVHLNCHQFEQLIDWNTTVVVLFLRKTMIVDWQWHYYDNVLVRRFAVDILLWHAVIASRVSRKSIVNHSVERVLSEKLR